MINDQITIDKGLNNNKENMESRPPESSRNCNRPVSVSQSFIDFENLEQEREILNQYQNLFLQQQQHISVLNAEVERLKSLKPIPWQNVIWQKITQALAALHGSAHHQPRFSLRQILFSYVGSFLGIFALGYLSMVSQYPLIAAPFGAAAVLVFAVPNSALAQPRNLIFGNLLGGIVSVVMVYLFGSEPWVMALSVATAIKTMQLTKTLHPPGGAVALVGVMSQASWSFVLTPVLLGSIILLLCTFVFNNLMPGRSYPLHWL